jgi:GNAT superfamily N-acetyltransferase
MVKVQLHQPCQLSTRHALTAIKAYDCWRLGRYLSIGDPTRGRIQKFHHATLLQFQDVGYFNRIYDFGYAHINQLDTIVDWYQNADVCNKGFGLEIVPAYDFDLQTISGKLERFGFRPATLTARVGLDLSKFPVNVHGSVDLDTPGIEFRIPTPTQYQEILKLYLQGFEAPVENHPGAIVNMMQLFGFPEFITWCAFAQGCPIGIGMMFIKDGIAVLAAGVTAPEYRSQGIHESLIKLRLQHAKSQGCKAVYSWCTQDGQSYSNLIGQSFEVLRTDRVWKLSSRSD